MRLGHVIYVVKDLDAAVTGSTAIDLSTLASMQSTLEAMDIF